MEPGKAPPRLQGAGAGGRSWRVARPGLWSQRRITPPHPRTLADPHCLTSGQHPGAELWVGGEWGSGVTPFTRGGARQSQHGAGQPELRGGPAGLLWGTGLRGRALTLGDLASCAHQAGHRRCSPGRSARLGSPGEQAAAGTRTRTAAPFTPAENARVLRRIQALLTPVRAVGCVSGGGVGSDENAPGIFQRPSPNIICYES